MYLKNNRRNSEINSNYWEPQPTTIPSISDVPIDPYRPNTPLGGYGDDEDVVVD